MAHALDLVGDRWAMLVVRELLLGPKRFTDLREGLPNASPTVLAQRLHDLERDGVVRRRKLGPPVGAMVYELTEWGRELEPVVIALGRWGVRSPLRSRDADFSADSIVLALRGMFDEDAADGLTSTYELRLGEHIFVIRVTDGRIGIQRGEDSSSDVSIETDRLSFAKLLMGAETIDDAAKLGRVRLDGDVDAVRKLFDALRVPNLVS